MAAMEAALAARRRPTIAAAVWAVAVLGQFCWRPVAAWSEDGHERIARIAQTLLQGKRRDQIRSLQHGDPIDFAGWEKNMTQRFPETDVLHWHHQNPEWSCMSHLGDQEGHIRCDGHGAEAGSLFCALAYFFESFTHQAIMEAYPEPRDPINTPKELLALEKVPSDVLTPATYLRWLGTLLGDLHQPLHWMREHEYGRRVKVIYQNQEYTLLNFWENYLPLHVDPIPPMEVLESKYKERVVDWKHKVPTELFREWAQEGAEKVCREVYSKMEVNHADGSRKIDPEFHLSEELFRSWTRIVEEQTILAGQRLAFVLLDILEHRRHHHAHQEGRGLRVRDLLKKRWRQNFLVNLGIGLVTVPLLLMGFRLHAGNAVSGRPSNSKN